MADWYYKISEDEHGPYSFEELGFLKDRCKLSPENMVREGKNGKWMLAGSVSEIFPTEIITRSKVNLSSLIEPKASTDIEQSCTGLDDSAFAKNDESKELGSAEPISPPLPKNKDDELNKRIAIGTTAGVGIILLLLLLLFLFWDDDRGGGGIAGTGIGDQQTDTEGFGSDSGIDTLASSAPEDEPSGGPSSSESSEKDESDGEATVSDVPSQGSMSEEKAEEPKRKQAGPGVLTAQRLPNANPTMESGGGSKREFNERLAREGAKTGDIQISLIWNNSNDLDLHVICPSGERISYQNKRASDGGELDVDMNIRGESRKPVENVFWPAGTARKGLFQIFVHHYSKHGSRDPTKFSIRVKVDGETKQFSGKLTHGQPPKLIHKINR